MIIPLIISIVLLLILSPVFKLIPKKLYFIVYILSFITSIIFSLLNGYEFINMGYLALSFMIVIMYVGVLSKNFPLFKYLESLRAEYSIIGFIFVIGHYIHIFLQFLVNTLNNNIELDDALESILGNATYITGIIAFIIMIPLFITSFIIIRKRFNNTIWKRIHYASYIVYILIFVHLLFASMYTNRFYIYLILFTPYFIIRSILFIIEDKFGEYSKLIASLLIISTILITGIFTYVKLNAPYSIIDFTNVTKEDGVYTGTSTGYEGNTVEIEVTISNNRITNITVIKCGCTGGKYSSYVDTFIQSMLNNNTNDVDTLTGSTKSNIGILKALNNALNK